MKEANLVTNVTIIFVTKGCMLSYLRSHEPVYVVLVEDASPAASALLIIEGAVVL